MARIAFVLVEPYADWEAALLAASAKSHLGDATLWLSQGGEAVRSMGGLLAQVDGAAETFDPACADALLFIGSPTWQTPDCPDLGPSMRRAADAGIVVGGICGATYAMARAGLLDGRPHTSNGLAELQRHGGPYRGAAHYRDDGRAVADGRLVTAAGVQPVSFAVEVLQLLHPEAGSAIAGFAAMFAREHAPRSR